MYAQIAIDMNNNVGLHCHSGRWKATGVESAVKLFDEYFKDIFNA